MSKWIWLAENIELNEPISTQVKFHGWTIHLTFTLKAKIKTIKKKSYFK